MKKHRFFHGKSSLLALILAMAMLLTTVGFAAEATAANADEVVANSDALDLPVYAVTDRGVALSVRNDVIRTDWDNSGCRLDTCFSTGDYLLRRLRLTFNDAYDLYDAHLILQDKNSIDTVMATTTGNSKTLRNLLSNSTYRNCRGADGIETLQNLKKYSEYRNNSQVRRIVDTTLSDIDRYYAPNLRESLEFFFPKALLQSLTPQELLQLSSIIIATPEYIEFHNTLYGHDCSTVQSLLNRGYSLDYVVRLYTNQAENAVATIWPDYEDRMDDYWRQYRAW